MIEVDSCEFKVRLGQAAVNMCFLMIFREIRMLRI